MTEFAVATVKQAVDLKRVNGDGFMGMRSPGDLKAIGARSEVVEMLINFAGRGWVKFERHPERLLHQQTQYTLTDAGKLALELREALGPDRGLTRAGAKALMRGAPTRATKIRLMDDGLWEREHRLGAGRSYVSEALTEDGIRVRSILLKYRAEV